MKTFLDILQGIRNGSSTQREKGKNFEKIIFNYFLTDPIYENKINKIWLWSDFPYKQDLSFNNQDVGIDLIYITNDDEYVAVQCKCYEEDKKIQKEDLDSFLSTSSKTFFDKKLNKKVSFSKRIVVASVNNFGSIAEDTLNNQNPPCLRIGLEQLENANVNWEKLYKNYFGDEAKGQRYEIRDHQKKAIDATHDHFKHSERGKLIMACGTGKTFTSLCIAENETKKNGICLYLVPSIALLGQTLREWYNQSQRKITSVCVCSDAEVVKKGKGKKEEDSESQFTTKDLAESATTDVNTVYERIKRAKSKKDDMIVIFSTYQSIDVVIETQKKLIKNNIANDFDMIICDEAHRTTGFARKDEDVKIFSKVHNNTLLKTHKRLYMTATPRIYGEAAKQKVKEESGLLFSMDDLKIYGEEIYRIGFGEAVNLGLLSDYKVYILTVFDQDVPTNFINECRVNLLKSKIADNLKNDTLIKENKVKDDEEIEAEDVVKIVGCINALSQTVIWGKDFDMSKKPMKSAVAFCDTIANSKKLANAFEQISIGYKAYAKEHIPNIHPVTIQADHVDGGMSAPIRYKKLSKLKEQDGKCHVLSNVRCLGEGVDVPTLDAVMFLSDKSSQVDIVQSVGRVMRKAEGKDYGYIIIPVLTKNTADAKQVLDKSSHFKVVWSVLNALRAHDERFDAIVNKIQFNKNGGGTIGIGTSPRPPRVGGIIGKPSNDGDNEPNDGGKVVTEQMSFDFEEFKGCIYAKLVEKVGQRDYWDVWAKDVANIALEQIKIITKEVNKKGAYKETFDAFLNDLKRDINPSIDKAQVIEMLSQHLITEPIFEALFGNNIFSKQNPISIAMEKMLSLLDGEDIRKSNKNLQDFYESVRRKVKGIDTAEGKQTIIKELYEKFFKNAFSKMVDKLGIVYTPVEVVDFIIHSVEAVLNKEFNKSLNDKDIHILDPFTGTGTFISRLLQSNIINSKNLERKYKEEIHANEIVLLAYYIASINIENIYHDLTKDINKNKNIKDDSLNYVAFDGICLTDTFQIGEDDNEQSFVPKITKENSKRVKKQMSTPIKIIIGNPPYSKGQKSANDNAQNERYEKLDRRITETYVRESRAVLRNSMYDTYFKAFRWSTDRIGNNKGIIAFITNSGWLDGNSGEGFRKTIEKEFSKIYVLNLRGAVRGRIGDSAKKEGQNVFAIMTGVAITILVKDPSYKNQKAQIFYHDIGDYLSRKEKLDILTNIKNLSNVSWKKITPNEHGDWISERNFNFKNFIPINTDKKMDKNSKSFFETYSCGLKTNRDAWSYNSSLEQIKIAAKSSINLYNEERKKLQSGKIKEVNRDTNKINWTRGAIDNLKRNLIFRFEDCDYRESLYRPFFKQNLLWYIPLIEMPLQIPKFFPTSHHKNICICVSSIGDNNFSVFITNLIPDLHLTATSQCFPLYWYESVEDVKNKSNDDYELSFIREEKPKEKVVDGYIRHDAVTDYILNEARKKYKDNSITKENIFYYVYGLLHSKDYREAFKADFKRELPRLPLVESKKDFIAFKEAGEKLAELHLNYEKVDPYPSVRVIGEKSKNYKITKLKYANKDKKDILIYNDSITIENIPQKAYEYVINGRSAIDWLIDRYQVSTDSKSGITNDPNLWCKEHKKPRYILDLILSVINVSVKSVDIIEKLPRLEF